jgi:hypothetical protein
MTKILMQNLRKQLESRLDSRPPQAIQIAEKRAVVPRKGKKQAPPLNHRPDPNARAIRKVARTLFHDTLGTHVLAPRNPADPTILDEFERPKVVIWQHQAPGDAVMLSAAVRDLARQYVGRLDLDVHFSYTENLELFKHNPYITPLDRSDPEVVVLAAEYDLINQSNQLPYHFIHAFRLDLAAKLNLPIAQGPFRGDIHLSAQEKIAGNPVKHLIGDREFWLLDAGYKDDITCKKWSSFRFQELINSLPDILFVQIGARMKGHYHPPLKGQNVIDLVGKTDIRNLVKLVYHCRGVITPISFPMHLSAAVPLNSDKTPPLVRKDQGWLRPCIVLAGGREAAHWEQYPGHTFLQNVGKLPCSGHGGCWRARLAPLKGAGDKENDLKNTPDKICVFPELDEVKEPLARCMKMITIDDVRKAILDYEALYRYKE